MLSSQESKENKENKENEPESLRSKLLAAQEQIQEKSKLISELQEELSDIVRNKSLQVSSISVLNPGFDDLPFLTVSVTSY